MKICFNCGCENPDSLQFCGKCGEGLPLEETKTKKVESISMDTENKYIKEDKELGKNVGITDLSRRRNCV